MRDTRQYCQYIGIAEVNSTGQTWQKAQKPVTELDQARGIDSNGYSFEQLT